MLGPRMELPASTAFVISLRHWAFVWPTVLLVSALALFWKNRADDIRLHFLGGMMLATVAVVIITFWCFFLPLFTGEWYLHAALSNLSLST
jgi:chromate transport protein ChrA